MEKNSTLVLGASSNPTRYANRAIHMLRDRELQVIALGKKSSSLDGLEILADKDQVPAEKVDTVTLYLNPDHQKAYQDWIISLQPRRVIFNPGSENMAFAHELKEAGIEAIFACTLVMLSTGQY